ncbi:hypothetical protein [Candidatus Magnetominusculus xianensis]|uniref:Uncharacterized protein n=1 Tax=Candidatus Magnetominusculus xianensis TaxID=1748249 RepID=A0ABR5SCR6_9BACT|nr:hypothetical protein [Candidatus Magnetominusculus xianensis]KWT82454.1 hypothetical protein ASN18_2486 [Candidatus Magnetominusculus xianensis]MBF0403174.1 hypothetical protein [Nitrospirota bacterium]
MTEQPGEQTNEPTSGQLDEQPAEHSGEQMTEQVPEKTKLELDLEKIKKKKAFQWKKILKPLPRIILIIVLLAGWFFFIAEYVSHNETINQLTTITTKYEALRSKLDNSTLTKPKRYLTELGQTH